MTEESRSRNGDTATAGGLDIAKERAVCTERETVHGVNGIRVNLEVNGAPRVMLVEPRTTLLEALRIAG